jgi:DNA-binding NarL/FixJ family response regulator
MNQSIKIALVDEEPLFLEGLSLLLSGCPVIQIVIKAISGRILFEKLERRSPGDFPQVVLLDVQTEPMSTFELIKCLTKRYKELRIIVLSSQFQQNMLGYMIGMGVSSFLPKNASLDILTEAIETVNRTGLYLRSQDQQMFISYIQKQLTKRSALSTEKLSEREQEVLCLICQEYTNAEIADKLFLSKRTVESHRQRIISKTGVKNTAGLVVYAICHEIFIPKIYSYL